MRWEGFEILVTLAPYSDVRAPYCVLREVQWNLREVQWNLREVQWNLREVQWNLLEVQWNLLEERREERREERIKKCKISKMGSLLDPHMRDELFQKTPEIARVHFLNSFSDCYIFFLGNPILSNLIYIHLLK